MLFCIGLVLADTKPHISGVKKWIRGSYMDLYTQIYSV